MDEKKPYRTIDKDGESELVFATNSQNVNRKLCDFIVTHQLEKGPFGKVYLSILPNGPAVKYVIKCIRKDEIADKNAIPQTFRELQILKNADHKSLINLHFLFNTNERFYFVMPFLGGGELFKIVEQNSRDHRFSEIQIKFYITQVILGLQYLHANQIIHSNLKVENLLLDETGYLKIVDFGLAQKLTSVYSSLKYNLDTGIPGCIAPELLEGKNLTFAADWWSVGIIMYQMLVGIDTKRIQH